MKALKKSWIGVAATYQSIRNHLNSLRSLPLIISTIKIDALWQMAMLAGIQLIVWRLEPSQPEAIMPYSWGTCSSVQPKNNWRKISQKELTSTSSMLEKWQFLRTSQGSPPTWWQPPTSPKRKWLSSAPNMLVKWKKLFSNWSNISTQGEDYSLSMDQPLSTKMADRHWCVESHKQERQL